MAVTKRTPAANTSTAAADRSIKPTLGFINVGIKTEKGKSVRIDSIRLMDGNEVHMQIFAGLNATRAGDEKLGEVESDAMKIKRLESFINVLEISFNPSRTTEDNKIALF